MFGLWRGSKAHPKVQEGEDGSLRLNFGDYGQEIEVAAFSGDGRRVLTVHQVGTAEVWEVESGRRVGVLRPTSPLEGGEAAPTSSPFVVFIEAAALDRTGERALLGLNDGTAGVFAVETGQRLSTLHHPETAPGSDWELVRAVNFSGDGRLALVGFYGRCVGVWEGTELRYLLRSPNERSLGDGSLRDTLVSGVFPSSDGRYVLGCCADGGACLWGLEDGRVVCEAVDHVAEVVGLGCLGERPIWATSDGSIYGWGGELLHREKANWARVVFREQSLEFLARSHSVGEAEGEGWTSVSAITQHPHPGVVARVRARHGEALLSDCLDWAGEVPVYPLSFQALRVGERLLEPGGDLSRVRARGDFLMVQLRDRSLWYRLADCRQPVGWLGAGPVALGRSWLAMREAQGVAVVRLSDGIRRECPMEQPPGVLAFGPDETWLAGWGKGLTVFDLQGEVLSIRWQSPEAGGRVDRLMVLEDGRILALGDAFRLYEATTGRLLRELPQRYGHACLCRILPGNRLLWSEGSQVGLWDIDSGQRETQGAPGPRPRGGLWHLPGGPYPIRYDGPRGWASTMVLSRDGREMLVETREGAAWVEVESGRVRGERTFEGRMRAGVFEEGGALLVTSRGELVAWESEGG